MREKEWDLMLTALFPTKIIILNDFPTSQESNFTDHNDRVILNMGSRFNDSSRISLSGQEASGWVLV